MCTSTPCAASKVCALSLPFYHHYRLCVLERLVFLFVFLHRIFTATFVYTSKTTTTSQTWEREICYMLYTFIWIYVYILFTSIQFSFRFFVLFFPLIFFFFFVCVCVFEFFFTFSYLPAQLLFCIWLLRILVCACAIVSNSKCIAMYCAWRFFPHI